MKRRSLLIFTAEFLWLVLIFAAALLSVGPLWKIISDEYVIKNFLLGLLFFFLFRTVIFFRSLALLKLLSVQILLFIAAILAAIFILNYMQEMFYLLDTYDLTAFLVPTHVLRGDEVMAAFKFFKKEFLLFSTGSLILLALLELRLLLGFFERIRKIE